MKEIPLFKVHMPESVREPLNKVLFSGFIGQGPKVEEFEKVLSKYFDNPNTLSLNSGTSAIHLALRLANIGPGDEVITTPMTCTATNMPIMATGAKMVWADIDPITGLICPDSIRSKITKKTKAIIMVHFGGIPCQIDEINEIAKSNNILTIEDAAHSFGSSYKNKRIGNHSDFVIFSFQAIKHITTVDGGLLITKRREDYDRGKLLRWYGIDRETPRKDFRCEENIHEYGYKFHMNDICACIGIEQMRHADKIISAHMKNADFYDEKLKNLKTVSLIPRDVNSESASWLYTIHVKNRDKFMSYMSENKVSTSKVHERNDIHDAFLDAKSALPGVDKFCETQVSIPVGWWLSFEDLNHISSLILEFDKNN